MPNRVVSIEDDPVEKRYASATPSKIFHYLFKMKTLKLTIMTIVSIYIMNFCNALAFKRMTYGEIVPDITFNLFPSFASLRKSNTYMKMELGDLYSIISSAALGMVAFFFWNHLNIAKILVTYNISIIFRGFVIIGTALPSPCTGKGKCPCATEKWNDISKNFSLIDFSIYQTFTVGTPAKGIPKCAGQTLSGHTVNIWVFSLAIIDTFKKAIPERQTVLLCIITVVYAFVLIVLFTEIAIRNQYTSDIYITSTVTLLVWKVYDISQAKHSISNKYFSSTFFGRLFLSFEEDSEEPNNNLKEDDITTDGSFDGLDVEISSDGAM